MSVSRCRSDFTLWSSVIVAALALILSAGARAALTPYTAGGANLVRMQQGAVDLTFTADGNLLGSLFAAHPGDPSALVADIISATPGGVLSDTYHGTWTLTASDFGADGRVTWFGAVAVIHYLNSVSFAGTSAWRLPNITDTGASGCDFGYAGTDCGYNVDVASSEFARLYGGELGRVAAFDSDGAPREGYGIFGNDGAQTSDGVVGPFSNVRSDAYWSGTEYAPFPGTAWAFGTLDGVQTYESKEGMYFMWAVTPGQVTPVPLPGAVWLLMPALLGLAGLHRRHRAA